MKFVVFNRDTRKIMIDLERKANHVYDGSRGLSKRCHRVDITSNGKCLSLDGLSVLPLAPDGGISVLTRRHASGILNSIAPEVRKVWAKDMAESLGISVKTVQGWRTKFPSNLMSSYSDKEVKTWYK